MELTMESGLPDPQPPPLDMSTRTTLGCQHVACSLMGTSTPTPTNPARCRGCGETFAAELESTGAPSSLRADAIEKAGHRRERREPRWEFEELSRALSKVLRHHPIVLMREDNAALLEDLVQALQHPDLGWEGLGVKEVEETVRRSHQILRDAEDRRWIRATSGHTFRQTGIEQMQNWISHALVKHCRSAERNNPVSLAELVRVVKEKVPSITEEAVLLVLEHETHNYDGRLRFEEVYEGPERCFRATESSKRYKRGW